MYIYVYVHLGGQPLWSFSNLFERIQQGWDSAVTGVGWFFTNLSPAFVFALVGMAIVVAFFVYYWYCLKPRTNSLEWIAMSEAQTRRKSMSLTLPYTPMERCDWIPLVLVTVLYAITAFFQLGSMSAPESYVKFQQGDSYTFSFSQPVKVDEISFYTALGTGTYRLEYTNNGTDWKWVDLDQNYATLFKWEKADLNQIPEGLDQPPVTLEATTFRITATEAPREEGVWLAELALWSDGEPLIPDHVDVGAQALFDEPEEWTTKQTYLNSTYFDEIYHPRTALEHLNNIYPYEVSHPPLGKLIMSIGIALFGMVPFGWRFMGTLFGVLMLPILYVFLKNFFGKTPVALCGTCLFAFDFMHLVQTRIGTIDTYGVFFILVSYYFMYRWLCCPVGSSLRKTAVPLFLCGLFWGIGCACKWTVIYAGAGLAVMWLLGLVFRYQEWKREPQGFDFISFVLSTTSLSIIFFVLLPSVIYTASYIPYTTAQGNLTLDNLLNVMWSNQEFMLSYHQGVHSTRSQEPVCLLQQPPGVLGGSAGLLRCGHSDHPPQVWTGTVHPHRCTLPVPALAAHWPHPVCLSLLPHHPLPGLCHRLSHERHAGPAQEGGQPGDVRLHRVHRGGVRHLLPRPHRTVYPPLV